MVHQQIQMQPGLELQFPQLRLLQHRLKVAVLPVDLHDGVYLHLVGIESLVGIEMPQFILVPFYLSLQCLYGSLKRDNL